MNVIVTAWKFALHVLHEKLFPASTAPLIGARHGLCAAYAGIGVETARALHETGADIYVTARDQTKAQSAIDDILKSSSGKGKLEILHLELGSLQSVREFAADFPRHSKQLNVLINNAGTSQAAYSAAACCQQDNASTCSMLQCVRPGV